MWVLTYIEKAGAYWDWDRFYVLGIFSSKEEAEKQKKMCGRYHGIRINKDYVAHFESTWLKIHHIEELDKLNVFGWGQNE